MKIHFISNSIYINSGFGKVTRYLAIGLKKLGYNVNMTGLQTARFSQFYYGIECLPVDTGGHVDESTQLFLNLQNIKPDVIIYVGQMDADLNHLTKIFDNTLVYVPVEGKNIPIEMANDLNYIIQKKGKVISQCLYGKDEMKKIGIESTSIYHGYDPEIFYPMKELKPYCYYATGVGKINTDPSLLCKMGCYHCTKNNKDCPYYKEEMVSILRWDKENKRWSQRDIEISKLKDEFRGKFLYLFIGQNFGIRKRIERLIKSYSILINESRQLKDKTHLHLHSLPISVQGINLIKIIQDLGINDNVSFSYGTFGSSGWSEEGINCLYNITDVNVSASSSEGFCLPVLEGMACGIPMIAPNCSSFTELIGEDPKTRRGLLTTISDWQMIQDSSIRALVSEIDLAHQMKEIYQNKDLRTLCSKNATKFVQDYTWEKIVKQWIELLASV
jgi:glycosyltransferase involved in cell wall biosynthesis